MGVNAQTSVPAFTTGQVLTAQQQTEINTGVPVFATTTTRDAAFGGTGEKVLAEGQLAYIEASDVVQYYNGTTWATLAPASAAALTLITTASYSASSSIALNSVFSSTYANYRFIHRYVTNTAGADTAVKLRVGTTDTSTGYSRTRLVGTSSAAADQLNSQTSWAIRTGAVSTANSVLDVWDITGPQLAQRTTAMVLGQNDDGTNLACVIYALAQTSTTQFDGMSITPGSGTITGQYWLFGYSNS